MEVPITTAITTNRPLAWLLARRLEHKVLVRRWPDGFEVARLQGQAVAIHTGPKLPEGQKDHAASRLYGLIGGRTRGMGGDRLSVLTGPWRRYTPDRVRDELPHLAIAGVAVVLGAVKRGELYEVTLHLARPVLIAHVAGQPDLDVWPLERAERDLLWTLGFTGPAGVRGAA